MQQQERDLIDDLFGRLQQFENQPRDAEAARLISTYVQRQPALPYLLTQTVLVQEEALKQAKARIAELESKAGSGSFLASAPRPSPWGAASQSASAPAPRPASSLAPWGAPAGGAPAAGAPAGGGFLRSALATAAGVAGGALLFEGIRNMFGHSTQAFASPLMDRPLDSNSPLMPSNDLASNDMASNDLASNDFAQDDGAADDYDLTSDNSGFDSSNDDL